MVELNQASTSLVSGGFWTWAGRVADMYAIGQAVGSGISYIASRGSSSRDSFYNGMGDFHSWGDTAGMRVPEPSSKNEMKQGSSR